MKKKIYLLLFSAMLCSMTVACGKAEEDSVSVTAEESSTEEESSIEPEETATPEPSATSTPGSIDSGEGSRL